MAGPGICVLFLAVTCASEVHPVFNPVAPYGYMLSNMYLFIADITNPDSFVYVVGPGLVSTSPAFVRSSTSHLAYAWPACTKNGKLLQCWRREGSTQFGQQFVTAPPLVGCVM